MLPEKDNVFRPNLMLKVFQSMYAYVMEHPEYHLYTEEIVKWQVPGQYGAALVHVRCTKTVRLD